MKNKVKKYSNYIKEATTNTSVTSTNTNTESLQNNTSIYKKYQSKVISMFNNAKPEDMEKISKNFENFINGLSDVEKGASDMLRTLFSSEKIKLNIKSLEADKIAIQKEIETRMSELKQITNNLNKK